MTVATSRPRVYIIDFEASVMFPEELPFESCVCVGVPTGGTITQWARALPPEVALGEPYSPFKLDVWQFGYSFTGLCTYRVIHMSLYSFERPIERRTCTDKYCCDRRYFDQPGQ